MGQRISAEAREKRLDRIKEALKKKKRIKMARIKYRRRLQETKIPCLSLSLFLSHHHHQPQHLFHWIGALGGEGKEERAKGG